MVTLNGRPHEIDEGTGVADLLGSLGLNGATVVVEINREIVPEKTRSGIALKDGDRIEIAQFVGGG